MEHPTQAGKYTVMVECETASETYASSALPFVINPMNIANVNGEDNVLYYSEDEDGKAEEKEALLLFRAGIFLCFQVFLQPALQHVLMQGGWGAL